MIKATEGTNYVNPDYERAYRQAKTAGKCLGIYHYANGGNIQAEADYFLANVGNCLGEAILILDWEGYNNASFGSCDYAWCKGWLDYVYEKTGVHPILYCSQSIANKFDNKGNYGLWIAQYADNDPTGYQDVPWNEGEYTCAIRQYTSCGRLNGYDGNLDLDKFYGSVEDWQKYTISDKTNVVVPEQPEAPKPHLHYFIFFQFFSDTHTPNVLCFSLLSWDKLINKPFSVLVHFVVKKETGNLCKCW